MTRSWDFSREKSQDRRTRKGSGDLVLPGGTAAFRVEVAGPTLVAAPPPGPGKQQDGTARQWEEQMSQQMTHFGNGQREERTAQRCFFRRRGSGERLRICAQMPARQANTIMTSVTCRYQAVKPRTS